MLDSPGIGLCVTDTALWLGERHQKEMPKVEDTGLCHSVVEKHRLLGNILYTSAFSTVLL